MYILAAPVLGEIVVLGGQRSLKPEGLKIEAEGRGRGGVGRGRVLGEKAAGPLPTAGGSGGAL